jgi:hypothetical protein
VKNSQFQSVINELIISERGKYGSVMFNEEEVALLWNVNDLEQFGSAVERVEFVKCKESR